LIAFGEIEMYDNRTTEKRKPVSKIRDGRGARPAIVGELLESIVEMHEKDEMSFLAIAKELNASGVPTTRGGQRWHDQTVRTSYLRAKGLPYRPPYE
jgi:hypothetical protein